MSPPTTFTVKATAALAAAGFSMAIIATSAAATSPTDYPPGPYASGDSAHHGLIVHDGVIIHDIIPTQL
jgi:hypothetical protein